MSCKICGNDVCDGSVDELCCECEVNYNEAYEDYESEEKIFSNYRKGGEKGDN